MQELGWVFGFSSNIPFGVVDVHKSTCNKSVFRVAGHNFIIYDGNTHTQVLFNCYSSILQLTKQDQEVLSVERISHRKPKTCGPDTVSSCCPGQKLHPYL